MFVSSSSASVSVDDNVVALEAFSVYVAVEAAVSTGASLNGVIVNVVVAVPVANPALSEFASVTDHVIVRVVFVPSDVGSSDVELYLTDCNKD